MKVMVIFIVDKLLFCEGIGGIWIEVSGDGGSYIFFL